MGSFLPPLVEKLGYLGVVAFRCQQEAVTLTQEDSVTGEHLFKAPLGTGKTKGAGRRGFQKNEKEHSHTVHACEEPSDKFRT